MGKSKAEVLDEHFHSKKPHCLRIGNLLNVYYSIGFENLGYQAALVHWLIHLQARYFDRSYYSELSPFAGTNAPTSTSCINAVFLPNTCL